MWTRIRRWSIISTRCFTQPPQGITLSTNPKRWPNTAFELIEEERNVDFIKIYALMAPVIEKINVVSRTLILVARFYSVFWKTWQEADSWSQHRIHRKYGIRLEEYRGLFILTSNVRIREMVDTEYWRYWHSKYVVTRPRNAVAATYFITSYRNIPTRPSRARCANSSDGLTTK